MKTLFLVMLLVALPVSASANLNIFACEPDWAALADMIGGDSVNTTSATNALQDPHYIQARPSLISKVRKADLVICSGAELEIGWLPMLLAKANNPKVQIGSQGYLEASSFVKRLDIPTSVDRSQGDVHPAGNPHIQTNPHNILLVADALAARMAELDPDNAEKYIAALENFRGKWTSAMAGWEAKAAPLKGENIITYHKSWAYLQDWLGLNEVATLERVSGVPPTAGHLSGLVRQFSDGGASVIIYAPYQSDKSAEWLSEKTAIPYIMLPMSVGGTEKASNLYSLFDDIIDRLLSVQK
jgi:zinc/manganese transport system substrate-binding protein